MPTAEEMGIEREQVTRSDEINVGGRIKIKEDCISLEQYKGKTGRVVEAVPHIRIALEELMPIGNGTYQHVLLMPIDDLEYIDEDANWEV